MFQIGAGISVTCSSSVVLTMLLYWSLPAKLDGDQGVIDSDMGHDILVSQMVTANQWLHLK